MSDIPNERELPSSIKELLWHLGKERKNLSEKISEQNTDLTPNNARKETRDNLSNLESLRIEEIDHFVNLLTSSANDEEVQQIAEDINKVYREVDEVSKIIPRPTTTEIEVGRYKSALASGDQEYIDAYNKRKTIERKLYVVMENSQKKGIDILFRDILRHKRVGTVVDSLVEGDPTARRRMLTATMELYGDVQDHILNLRRELREDELNNLDRVLLFYKTLLNGEGRKTWAERIKKKVEETAADPDKQTFRDYVWKAKNKMQNITVDGISLIFGGDDDSVITYVAQKFVSLEQYLSKPEKPNDPIVLAAIEKDVNDSLAKIADGIDEKVLDDLINQRKRLYTLPDEYLPQSEREEFSKKFDAFLKKIVLPIQKNLIDTHEDIIANAYMYSHGDTNSIMSPDEVYRAKLSQKDGIDVRRALEMFAPFGIMLPKGVKLKPFEERFRDYEKSLTSSQKDEAVYLIFSGIIPRRIVGWDNFSKEQKQKYFREYGGGNIENIKLKSYWDRGFWKEHEVLSFIAQASITGGAYIGVKKYVAPFALWVARKIPVVKFFIPKVIPPWLLKYGKLGARAYMGYIMGDWVNSKIMDHWDENVRSLYEKSCDKYGYHAVNFPEEVKQELRNNILTNEIQRRRGYFQGIGYDISRMGVDFWNRVCVGAALGSEYSIFRDSMVRTGAFREAVFEANKQIVEMGLEPFIIK